MLLFKSSVSLHSGLWFDALPIFLWDEIVVSARLCDENLGHAGLPSDSIVILPASSGNGGQDWRCLRKGLPPHVAEALSVRKAAQANHTRGHTLAPRCLGVAFLTVSF